MRVRIVWLTIVAFCLFLPELIVVADDKIDFNQQIRPILSNNCFRCHGPDAQERAADLRLDTAEGAAIDLGGYKAIVPGKPDQSELVERISSKDPDLIMPPADSGHKLKPGEIDLLTRWIQQGAHYAVHWSYVLPKKSPVPKVQRPEWPRNAIDHFILSRLEQEGGAPTEPADRYTIIRRLSLDLTGLPPTPEEVTAFVEDSEPGAYERLVDRLLAKPGYGEHWSRMWLDLARYADSAGYADDRPRTIWAFRDYVIRSLNENKRFDQFTIEQIAGDLLPEPTEQQLIATAFHRNTLTNNEGGTNDEEFRNVAIVDRVNTTMAVWMATTIDCCQCHDHKYDPISQEEYYEVFAIFNNTEDSDKADERPYLKVTIGAQDKEARALRQEIAQLEQGLRTMTPDLTRARRQWEAKFAVKTNWQALRPDRLASKSKREMTADDEGVVRAQVGNETDVYTLEFPLKPGRFRALRVEALADEGLASNGPGHVGNFVLSGLKARLKDQGSPQTSGRFVRIELPGKARILSLAEVEVFSGNENLTRRGVAMQSSTDFNGPARLAIDGNSNGDYTIARSTTHTKITDDPWWEVDLKSVRQIDRIIIWNRTDNGLQHRLDQFRIVVLDENREAVWQQMVAKAPQTQLSISPDGSREIRFATAHADFEQNGFPASAVLDGKTGEGGWAVAPRIGQNHQLTLMTLHSINVPPGTKLIVQLEQLSKWKNHTLGKFRLLATGDDNVGRSSLPKHLLAILETNETNRTAEQRTELDNYFLSIAPETKATRQRLEMVKKQLASAGSTTTTVPIMRELPQGRQRKSHVQIRGNFLSKGKEVQPGTPATFHPIKAASEKPNRLDFARWLVDAENPLTARVVVNRYWEAVFGVGLVRTSEEFGSQGELPSHPELLDFLAVDFVENGWDVKRLMKLLVTSAAYRQSSRVTPELLEADPDNRLLARGPRFRLSAEMIRDQALAVSGLLSTRMYGPSVNPPKPNTGLKAAFGSGTDWKTSTGEDRYRRGLYTQWRRSSPYPSMAAFDAPNREVCTIRRDRTNTPLQALVTLNDPVYIEAAQALARRIIKEATDTDKRVEAMFFRCTSRQPDEKELAILQQLLEDVHTHMQDQPDQAMKLATNPIGPLPEGVEAVELAAWTIVANVILNLDEMLMKR